jgi:hypothetical protein
MSPLYSAEHAQLPNRVLLLCSPCAPRLQMPCSASRVVPGAHRVVGPGTHRGSGPREVHTTIPAAVPPSQALQRHPQHCGNPDRWDIATPAVVWPLIFRQLSPRTGVRTTTKQELQRYYPRSRAWTGTGLTTTPAEARFVRTTVNSTTLCAMLPHVALRAAWHDCKPPPFGL